MDRRRAYRTIFFIWLGWAVALFAYQAYVAARLDLARPDYALEWTQTETLPGSQDGKPYLNEPFLNSHVSWDSEYYLAIATAGYEAPTIHRINATMGPASTGGGFWPFIIPENASGILGVSLAYAFFPFYPLVMRIVAIPLSLLGMNAIATATLAGVLVSSLGALAAMLALYELASDEMDDAGGLRAAFYLVIFPSGFFLAQVYTEGLFVGLAFWALVLIRRGRLGWAALLAVLATFTRAVGVALAAPLLIAWLRSGEWHELDLEWRQVYFKGLPWKVLGRALLVLAPVLAFLVWRVSYFGLAFSKVEEEFFGRGLLSFGYAFIAWLEAFGQLFGDNSQAAAYYLVEWGGIVLGFTACIVWMRRQADVAWFGLLVVFLSFTSGPAQGMHRYILAAPPVFLWLSWLGRRPAFDKTWTVVSVLLMGVLAALFTFDMWTG
jgi:hypothetical protein